MFFLTIVLIQLIVSTDASILKCDFQSACTDFTSDSNWGITDGLNPRPIDHDHTWNNRSGRYLFFISQNDTRRPIPEVKTSDWLNPSTDRAVCFQVWYYTTTPDLIFTVQLLQGDNLALTRVVAQVEDDQPSVTDWTLLQVVLPPEKIKIAIRTNATSGNLALDDLVVDYCDEPRPPPIETLFQCDFESSCDNQLISPTEYPYQWSKVEAGTAVSQESEAPAVDYTVGNKSGHYTWLANRDQIASGKVGHLLTRMMFNITEQKSFCLSFQYYFYGTSSTSNLFVYASGDDGLQRLWPISTSSYISYARNRWAWGIINLPVGEYSILFRMTSDDYMRNSVAVDDIIVSSCDYPAYSLNPDYFEGLTFAAHFDDGTMDGIKNSDQSFTPTHNFTLMTGSNIPDPTLGPTHDHTHNSSTGGFIYWNQQLPYVPNDNGIINPSQRILQNLGMCLQFAYYVKSNKTDANATQLTVTTGGCYGATLWSISLDDSQGWQVAKVPVKPFTCSENYYFWVSQGATVVVAIAFDDIEIAQCSSFDPPTTTTTTTATSTTTITSTSTTTTATTTTSTTPVTTTSITPLTTTSTTPITTTSTTPVTITSTIPITTTSTTPVTTTSTTTVTTTSTTTSTTEITANTTQHFNNASFLKMNKFFLIEMFLVSLLFFITNF